MKAAESNPEEYYRFFNALPAFTAPELRKRTLAFAFSPSVRSQDAPLLLSQLLGSDASQDETWEYIKKEKLEVPNIYFSHERECFRRGGQWLPVPPAHAENGKPDLYAGARPKPTEPIKNMVVRVRTIADMISTGMIESPADSVDDIIGEVAAARVTERGTRADDKASEAAMEDRKKAGYF
jgi:sulfate adenylyltransferase subunit 2